MFILPHQIYYEKAQMTFSVWLNSLNCISSQNLINYMLPEDHIHQETYVMQHMSIPNKNLKTVVNLRNYGIQSIPATVLDYLFCQSVVFETFKLFSRGKMWSFGDADDGTGDKDWSKMKSKPITDARTQNWDISVKVSNNKN